MFNVFLSLLLESNRKGDVVDMSPHCERLCVDIVGQLVFGFELNPQGAPTHWHVAEDIKARLAIGSVCMPWPSLRILSPIITWLSLRHYKNDKGNLLKKADCDGGWLSSWIQSMTSLRRFRGKCPLTSFRVEGILFGAASMQVARLLCLAYQSEERRTDMIHRRQHHGSDTVNHLLLPLTKPHRTRPPGPRSQPTRTA